MDSQPVTNPPHLSSTIDLTTLCKQLLNNRPSDGQEQGQCQLISNGHTLVSSVLATERVQPSYSHLDQRQGDSQDASEPQQSSSVYRSFEASNGADGVYQRGPACAGTDAECEGGGLATAALSALQLRMLGLQAQQQQHQANGGSTRVAGARVSPAPRGLQLLRTSAGPSASSSTSACKALLVTLEHLHGCMHAPGVAADTAR